MHPIQRAQVHDATRRVPRVAIEVIPLSKHGLAHLIDPCGCTEASTRAGASLRDGVGRPPVRGVLFLYDSYAFAVTIR